MKLKLMMRLLLLALFMGGLAPVAHPNPYLRIEASYNLIKLCSICEVDFNFSASWLDVADMHPLRDGKLLDLDWVAKPLQYGGIGKEFLIDITWKASGSAEVTLGDENRFGVRGSGWPFN